MYLNCITEQLVPGKGYLIDIMLKYLTDPHHDNIGISKAVHDIIRISFTGIGETVLIRSYLKCNFLDMEVNL
jgi:hypothetical protein